MGNAKHGHTRGDGWRSPTYLSWQGMKQRVLNSNSPDYEYYGGRGITVCDRWLSFETFLADMGERPNRRLTLERKDTNGAYEPRNCKWATRAEQQDNRRAPRGPAERRQRAAALQRQGFTLKEIGANIGMTRTSVWRTLQKFQ